MKLASNLFTSEGFIFLWIVLIFGFLCVVIFLIRKFVINRKKKDEKPSDDQIREETLNRYLEDVEDEETKKQFEKLSEEESKKNNDNQKKEDK